jgi:hypothetical protein
MIQLLISGLLLFSTNASAATSIEQARQAYAQRDFNDAGIKKVREAITLYEKALLEISADTTRRDVNQALADAHYFLGTAVSKNSEKKSEHQMGMDLADQIINNLGADAENIHKASQADVTALLNRLNETEEMQLAQAMYSKGVNLAQWGKLNGIASSINRLPVVLGLMERIEMMGYKEINQYGPDRTYGRIKFSLPGVFGGDLEESETRLKEAYRQTLAPGQRYSINGYNNIYLAETLHSRGKENQAKKILETFLAADLTTLVQGQDPENREAMRVAQDLYDSWK